MLGSASIPTWVHNLYNENQGIQRTLAEGVKARIFPGQNVMLSIVQFEPNATHTPHSHPQEQWGILLEGEGTRLQGSEAVPVKAGDFWHTPGGVSHTFQAGPAGALVLDIFSPPRTEYAQSGTDIG
jgi:quercetin dioxygenase-like cupin family protein